MKTSLSFFISGQKEAYHTINRWGKKTLFGFIDQGLFSGVNFVVVVLLARWVSTTDYGGFSIVYSGFILLSGIQVGLIAEPMSIYGARSYTTHLNRYLGLLFRLQTILIIGVSCLLALLAFFLNNHAIRSAQYGLAIGLPFIFGYWYFRRAYYINSRSDLAMLSSLIYSFSMIVIIVFFRLVNLVTPFSVFLAMGIASCLASLPSIKQLDIFHSYRREDPVPFDSKDIIRECWNYGKWMLLAYTASWATTMAYPLIINFFLGIDQAGAFRAIQNLFLPLQQIVAAVTLLILPWMAKQKAGQGYSFLRKFSLKAIGVGLGFSFLYWFIAWILGSPILDSLYKNSYYSHFSYLIPAFGISSLLGVIPLVTGLSFRVIDLPKIILWGKSFTVLVIFTLGIWFIIFYGMMGVAFCLITAVIVETFITLLFFIREFKKESPLPE